MNSTKNCEFINKYWDEEVIPALSKYISIPCKSLDFDPDWKKTGHLDAATKHVVDWVNSQGIKGTKAEIIYLKEYTPVIFVEIPASTEALADKTVMFYSHIDKMPESEGWDKGYGPWTPVLKDNKLFGRGAVDDGYAAFLPIVAIKSLLSQGLHHPRCVLLLESAEESGSVGFEDYISHLKDKIKNPDLIIVSDAGGEDFDHLWITSSLRGIVEGTLRVEVLERAVHSGMGTGIIPSSFRIMRELLSRIEDSKTGELLLPEFYVDIPKERIEQAKALAKTLGEKVYNSYPFSSGVKPVVDKFDEIILNSTWRPGLAVIAADGFQTLDNAGNVIRPFTTLDLSFRIPPNCDPKKLVDKIKQIFESNPPYNAKITFTEGANSPGWDAPAMPAHLSKALDEASKTYFGKDAAYVGCGGGIGVVKMMGDLFPKAQFIVTGIEGPGSNAHGPNESLNIDAAKKLTCCMSDILQTYSK